MKYLSFRYFQNGDEDIYSRYIMECFHQKAYYLIKNLYTCIKAPQFLFLNELSYYLPVIDRQYISRMYCPLSPNPFYSIRRETINTGYKDVFNFITSILSHNNFPIVQTFIERVPFMRYYDLNKPFTAHIPSHVFMIVSESKDSYYVVEEEWVIDANQNYTYSRNNKDIGIVPKKMLIDAFSQYANLFQIMVRRQPSDDAILHNAEKLLRTSVNNYYAEFVQKNGREEVFWGRKALQKLTQLSELNSIELTDYVSIERDGKKRNTDDILCYMFSASFNVLVGYRKLFLSYMKGVLNNTYLEQLMEKSIFALEEWKFVNNKILAQHQADSKYRCLFSSSVCRTLGRV